MGAELKPKVVNAYQIEPQVVKDIATGTTIRWIFSKEDGVPNFSMRMFQIEPGGTIEPHSHPWEHEIYVLSGRGIIMIGNEKYEVEPNVAVFIPPNVSHSYQNDSDETLTFLCLIPHHE